MRFMNLQKKLKFKLFNSLERETWQKIRENVSANIRDKILTNSNRVTEPIYAHVRNYCEAIEISNSITNKR